MSRLVVLTISVFVGLVVPILCKRGIETFSAGSFVLGGFCISTILAALGFAVVHADKKHEEEQNEEEV